MCWSWPFISEDVEESSKGAAEGIYLLYRTINVSQRAPSVVSRQSWLVKQVVLRGEARENQGIKGV